MMSEMIPGSRPVTIYISAAADLMAEREVLGRMIAGLPVTLAWRIGQTPLGVEPLNLEVVRQADLYLLLLGGDIRAPVGLEWYTAAYARRPISAFLKQGLARTMAGQAFVRDIGVDWQPFRDPAHLCRQVERLLADYLLRHSVRFALTPPEVERLTDLLKTEAETDQPAGGEGTGHSAVLLSRERYMPSEGIIVDSDG